MMRVLYVEDNAADADLARRHFRRHASDIELVTCDSQQAALTHLRASTNAHPLFDLVLADVHLPDGSGMGILAHIRTRTLPIAVVVVTGSGSETLAVAALKAGADDYIVKRQDYLDQLPGALRHSLRRFRNSLGRYHRPLNVLYAEHHPADADLTLRHMQRYAPHIQFDVVHTAADALARLLADQATERYHVLLMDYRLPGMNALDLVKELERRERHEIPVVMVTGQGDEEIAAQALRLGVADYVVKNRGYLQQLPHTLENVVNNAMLLRERAALYESEQRYRTLVEFAPAAIFTKDSAGRFTSANALMQERFALDSEAAFLGKTIFDIASPDLAAQAHAGDQTVIQSRSVQTSEERQMTPDGERVYLTRKAPLFDAQGRLNGIMGVSIDLTERLQMEAARRENEERFLQLAQHIDQVFWLQDAKTNQILYISPAFEKVYGRACADAYADHQVMLEAVHPDDREQALATAEPLRQGLSPEIEFRISRPDGSLVWAVGQTFPVIDETGEMVRVAGLVQDVTERRRSDEHVQQQARLAAVGQMAAGIAHDFNNILAIIMLYTEMLQLTMQSSLQQRQLNTIFQQARHASDLVQQILDFSRRSPLERIDLTLQPFLKELVKLWERTLPENIELAVEVDDEPLVVSADPARLQQALMNIVFNARDAMPHGGKLSICATRFVLRREMKPPLPMMDPGAWLQLALRDTGPGIAANALPHIFEPFFTTKEPGQGTGLGLAQVFGIVRQLGGQIAVDNGLDHGACFTLYLPLLDEPHILTADDTHDAPLGNGETILLIEDDDALREAIQEMLVKLGYEVIEAQDGHEALHILSEHGRRFDLILGDLVMPGLGGLAFRKQMLERVGRDNFVPMLLMTGYPVEGQDMLHEQYQIGFCLQKPFTLDRLAEAVGATLRTHASAPDHDGEPAA